MGREVRLSACYVVGRRYEAAQTEEDFTIASQKSMRGTEVGCQGGEVDHDHADFTHPHQLIKLWILHCLWQFLSFLILPLGFPMLRSQSMARATKLRRHLWSHISQTPSTPFLGRRRYPDSSDPNQTQTKLTVTMTVSIDPNAFKRK